MPTDYGTTEWPHTLITINLCIEKSSSTGAFYTTSNSIPGLLVGADTWGELVDELPKSTEVLLEAKGYSVRAMVFETDPGDQVSEIPYLQLLVVPSVLVDTPPFSPVEYADGSHGTHRRLIMTHKSGLLLTIARPEPLSPERREEELAYVQTIINNHTTS